MNMSVALAFSELLGYATKANVNGLLDETSTPFNESTITELRGGAMQAVNGFKGTLGFSLSVFGLRTYSFI